MEKKWEEVSSDGKQEARFAKWLSPEGVEFTSPEAERLYKERATSVKDAHLLEPAVAFKIYSSTELSQLFSMKANSVVPGSFLPSLLPGAEELAVVVGTIGPNLEKQVTGCFD
jgi:hypothetical protein